MAITTNNARIETASPQQSDEHSAFFDASFEVGGFAAVVRFHPGMNGHFVLATRHGDTSSLYLIGVPSQRWLGDMKDAGYTIIQTLDQPANKS